MSVTEDEQLPADVAAQDNARIGAMLREAADLLAAQNANPFRVNAYRRAAGQIEALPRSVRELFEREGRAGLDVLPRIGPGLAAAIAEILLTGSWGQLDRLHGHLDPVRALQAAPGIGEGLSRRIHDELHVETLEELEAAAFDGRLAAMHGVGARRAEAIGAALGRLLDRGRARRRAPAGVGVAERPPVGLLLTLDQAYRERALAGLLPTIAPRRFNPSGQAWLPIWHTDRPPWHFTILYSNTQRAHELKRERDWVVAYFHDGDGAERQHTIVTETTGTLAGRRVVRGREGECREWYERAEDA